jgi:two-component system OmpR family sensor kinase
MKSIRQQLLMALLSTIMLTTLLGALATYRTARDEAQAMFDYQLRQLALSLRDHALQNGPLREFRDRRRRAGFLGSDLGSGWYTRIYLSHPRQELPHQAPIGFATVDTGHGQWRVFGMQQAGQMIQVAQPMQVRDQLALAAAWRTVAPFLLMLPMLGVLIWIVVGRGLRPLDARRAGGEHAHRGRPRSLARKPRARPRWCRWCGRSTTSWIACKRALVAQREFIADAAHELRTPLDGADLQVQLAERAAMPVACRSLRRTQGRAAARHPFGAATADAGPAGTRRWRAATGTGAACRAGGTGHRRSSATGGSSAGSISV